MIKTYKELLAENTTDSKIKKLIEQKELYKIEKGYYSSSEIYDELELITKKYNNAIITMESAFYYYGLSSKHPKKYTLATLHKAKVIKNKTINIIITNSNSCTTSKIYT